MTMTALIPFSFEGASVRVIMKDGEPWFILADVCEVLEISNSRHAASRLDDDEKGVVISDTLGGPQEMATINESGLYSLILTSRKPAAKRFKKWVTADVIPSIRKTGSYGAAALPAIDLSNPDQLLQLLTSYALDKKALMAKVEAQEPTVTAYNRIAGADGAVCMTDAAKALQVQPQKVLIPWMVANKWVYGRAGKSGHLAYQDKIQAGLLKHKVRVVEDTKNGGDKVVESVLVTPAGIAKLAKLVPGAVRPGELPIANKGNGALPNVSQEGRA